MSAHNHSTSMASAAARVEPLDDRALSLVTGGESQFSGKADGAAFLGLGTANIAWLAYDYVKHDLFPAAKNAVVPMAKRVLRRPML